MDRPQKRRINNNQADNMTYKKVNAYSQRSSLQQILTLVLFIIELILYNVFITSSIARQDSPILWLMLAVTYILFAIIAADYFYLTCSDPVDDLLLGINDGIKQSQTKQCQQCCARVHKSSHHCRTCKRCVSYFDHHCNYLNNCIGGKNYHNFFRMLVNITAFCLLIIGSSIWILVFANNDEHFNQKILSKWGVLATLLYTIVMMISVDTLLCFHCYLVLKLKKTTLYFVNHWKNENVDSSKQMIE